MNDPKSDPPASPESPSLPGPLVQGSDLLWIVLWSVLLALGVALGASAWREAAREAAARPAIILPASDPSETERGDWPTQLRADERVESAEWISPGALVQSVSASVQPELWSELFSEDDAWLPWLLRINFTDPAAAPEEATDFIVSLRADARYKLVLFDQELLERDALKYRRLRHGTFAFAGIMLTVGALALLFAPLPRRRGLEAILGGVLAAAGVALGGLLLRRLGAPLAEGPAWRAVSAGFGLAALVGPMLKGRLTSILVKRGDK
jgi:hypothetical protein